VAILQEKSETQCIKRNVLWSYDDPFMRTYENIKTTDFQYIYFNKTVTDTAVVSLCFPLKIISTASLKCGDLALNRLHIHACIRTIQETALLLIVNVPYFWLAFLRQSQRRAAKCRRWNFGSSHFFEHKLKYLGHSNVILIFTLFIPWINND
jgi:hypothetical protein